MKKWLSFLIFGSIFLLVAFFGMSALQMCFDVVENTYVLQLEQMKWMFYGILFASGFALFFRAIPSYKEYDSVSDDEFLKSLAYYLAVFLLFLLLIFIWGNIIIWGSNGFKFFS